ncbi:MAG: hypothetical protein JW748_00865 [Anaerolineales bacterium]|nr:hypothetical protein [Anaerolineales bacterium]
MSGKWMWIVLAAVIALSALLGVGMIHNGHVWGDDFASYIMQAESIVEGRVSEFLTANAFTMTQSSKNLGPVAYPWGTSVLLALPTALFGLNLAALKAVNVICHIFCLIILAFGFRRRLSSLSWIGLAALMGLNPAVLSLFNDILSDIPFLLFSMAAILLIQNVLVERHAEPAGWKEYTLLGVFLAASCFVRTAGIILVCIALLSELIALAGVPRSGTDWKGWKPWFLHALPYLVFLVLAGMAYLLLPGGEQGYLQSLGEISLGQIKTNFTYYVERWQLLFAAVPFYPLVFGAALPFVLIGVLRNLRRYYVFAIYGAAMMGMILLWPATQGIRFLLPILPLGLFFFFLGVEWFIGALEGAERKAALAAAFLCVALVGFFFLRQSAELTLANQRSNRAFFEGPFSNSAQELFEYIENNSTEESVILFFKPRALRLTTGRPSLQISESSDIDRGDYLCIFEHEDEGLQIANAEIDQLKEAGRLILIFQNEDFRLYRILDSSGGS